jgi:phosphate transport system permease protein
MTRSNVFGRVAPARRRADAVFRIVCLVGILAACLFLVLMLWSVAKDGVGRINAQFFEGIPSRLPARAGIKVAALGTLWVMLVTIAIAVPTGVAAAVYLEMFTSSRNKLASFIQLNISNLAGVPSIVYGLLGLALFVRFFGFGRSVLAGGLTMAILILPMIIVVSQEAVRAVPRQYAEGSIALGATKWQTVFRQVLPAALPGVITGIILSVSRAIGETAPLITIGAVTFIARPPEGLESKFTVMPIQIYEWSSRPQQGFHEAAAGAIIVLIAMLLVLNSAAIVIRARAQRKV